MGEHRTNEIVTVTPALVPAMSSSRSAVLSIAPAARPQLRESGDAALRWVVGISWYQGVVCSHVQHGTGRPTRRAAAWIRGRRRHYQPPHTYLMAWVGIGFPTSGALIMTGSSRNEDNANAMQKQT